MSLKFESPKTLNATDMFIWWAKNKIRNKRHLKIKDATTHSKTTTLISKNGDELDWLRKHVLVLAEQIENLEKDDNEKYYFTKTTEQIYIKKRELYEATNRINHLEQVDSDNAQVVMSEAKFREILCRFNKKVRDSLIADAGVVNIKNKMGFIYVEKIARHEQSISSKSSRMPNWLESNRYKQELIDKGIQIKDKEHPDGRKWIVYYDDDYYLRFSWIKNRGACRVKNHNYYSFNPSYGETGPKKQLVEANKKNPYLHKTYVNRKIYFPNLDKMK